MASPARRYSSTSAARSADPASAGSVPRSSVRSAATVARIWSRLARPDGLGVDERPLGLVDVASQHVARAGDVEQHGGERVAGQVVQLAGDAAPLLGDRLLGERLPGRFELRRSARWWRAQDATQREGEDGGRASTPPTRSRPSDASCVATNHGTDRGDGQR